MQPVIWCLPGGQLPQSTDEVSGRNSATQRSLQVWRDAGTGLEMQVREVDGIHRRLNVRGADYPVGIERAPSLCVYSQSQGRERSSVCGHLHLHPLSAPTTPALTSRALSRQGVLADVHGTC